MVKKVALLMFGEPRFLSNRKSGKGFNELIIDKYQTEIFGHVWLADEYRPSTWNGLEPIKAEQNILEKLRGIYQGIKLRADDSIKFNSEDLDINNLYSHFYSIEEVGKVFKVHSNINNYDFIILSRWDLDLISFDSLENLTNGFYSLADHPGIADQLFIFSPEYISFLNLFSNIENLEKFTEGIEFRKKIHFLQTFPESEIKKHPFQLEIIRNLNN